MSALRTGLARERLDQMPFRSLRAKFLAINVPLVVAVAATLFAVFELTAYRAGLEELGRKLDVVIASQSAVLADPVWNLNTGQVQLAVAAMTNDSDIAGAVVVDESGGLIAATGAVDEGPESLVAARRIEVFRDGRRRIPVAIGRDAIVRRHGGVLGRSQRCGVREQAFALEIERADDQIGMGLG